LLGLILIDSAPDASWQLAFEKMMHASPIKEFEQLDQTYRENPSNEVLKAFTLAAAPYVFTEKGLQRGRALLQSLPYNYETFEWSKKHFDSTYKALWVPQNLPTLIIAGAEDYLTPLALFRTSEAFNRNNILIKEINHGGHFPWIENPHEVAQAFDAYLSQLLEDL
jgi:pimeloyl-ACP methyl ester carboxylesterase